MRGLDRWIDAGFGGEDRRQMEQDISRRPRSMKRVSRADFEQAIRKLHAINREIANGLMTAYPDVSARVMVEDWRTSDSPEAAAERARFEKEHKQ